MTTKKIDMMSPASGRMRGEDDGVINVADEIKGINATAAARSNTLHINYTDTKAAILAAETVEEIEAITYG